MSLRHAYTLWATIYDAAVASLTRAARTRSLEVIRDEPARCGGAQGMLTMALCYPPRP